MVITNGVVASLPWSIAGCEVSLCNHCCIYLVRRKELVEFIIMRRMYSHQNVKMARITERILCKLIRKTKTDDYATESLIGDKNPQHNGTFATTRSTPV